MGFLDELKKALFGAKSVTKHSAQRTAQAAKEKADDILEDVDHQIDSYKKKGKKMIDDYELDEKIETTKQKVKETTEKALDETEEAIDRIKSATEDIGEKILDKTADALEKAQEVADGITNKGKKLIDDHGDTVKEKIEDIGEQVKSKFDETFHRAQQAAQEEKINKDKPYESSEKAQKTLGSSSLPEDSDDFWEKASAYADGRYNDIRDTGAIKVIEDDSTSTPPLASSENIEKKTPLLGFTDEDNDGDEIIDDAVIDDEK